MGRYYVAGIPFDSENSLKHYGVKNMEWGKHKFGIDADDRYIKWLKNAGANIGKFATNVAQNVAKGATTAANTVGSAVNKGANFVTGNQDRQNANAKRSEANTYNKQAANPVRSMGYAGDTKTARPSQWFDKDAGLTGRDYSQQIADQQRVYASKAAKANQEANEYERRANNAPLPTVNRTANQLGSAAGNAGKWAGQQAQNAGKAIGTAAGNAGNWANEQIKNVGNFVTGDQARKDVQDARSHGGVEQIKNAQNAYNKTLPGMIENAPNVVDQTREGIGGFFDRVVDQVREAAGNVGNAVSGISNNAAEGAKGFINNAGKWVSGAANNVKNAASKAASDATKGASGFINSAGKWVSNTAQNVGNLAGQAAQAAQNVGNAIGKYTAPPRVSVHGDLSKAPMLQRMIASGEIPDPNSKGPLLDWAGQAAQNVGQAVNQARNGVGGFFDRVGDWGREAARNVGNTVGQAANQAREGIGGFFDRIGDWGREAAGNVGNAVSGAAQNVGNAVSGAAQNVGNWAGQAAQNVGNLVSEMANPHVQLNTQQMVDSYKQYLNDHPENPQSPKHREWLKDQVRNDPELRAFYEQYMKHSAIDDKPEGVSDAFWAKFTAEGGTREEYERDWR